MKDLAITFAWASLGALLAIAGWMFYEAWR
jgi:hypothetical protein